MITPKMPGQIVRFHTPLADENPDQKYVVLEWHEDADPPRAKIKALGTGLPFPPVSVVSTEDLVSIDANTSDLLGVVAYISKADSSKILGRIIKVHDETVSLDMEVVKNGVVTNVAVTVIDNDGTEHSGVLFVS